MRAFLKFIAIAITAIIISGCSSDSVSSRTGKFIDDPVSGLNYTCSSGKVDVTNSEGNYTCKNGDTVTFKIGDVVIGIVNAEDDIVTPYTFFPNDDNSALNLARLLQSLDSISGDGIITFDNSQVALLDVNTDFTSPSFAADVESDLGITLVSIQEAKTLLNKNIIIAGGNVPDGSNIPIANAGIDQNVHNNNLVTLDASASSDQDGDIITYSWSIKSKPAMSIAMLSNKTIVNPTFTADKTGSYILQLRVNDGSVDSPADEVTIVSTVGNAKPIANAGIDQNVTTTSIVTLDGSASSDADLNPLTFNWIINSLPKGSITRLSDETIVNPTFEADIDGTYEIQLIVNDGIINSNPDIITVTAKAANSAPIANAGIKKDVNMGDIVTLDGSRSSDANMDALNYLWNIISKPIGSTATLSNSTTVSPTFTADLIGNYIISLVVNDGTVDSINTSNVTVTASSEIIHNSVTYRTIVSPYTSRIWLDRNLGANQVCTNYNDVKCYGDYYQWGRNTDGHEKSTSEITTSLATTLNNVGIYYISNLVYTEHDWIDSGYHIDIDDNGLLRQANWKKTDGSSICPVGFRVPSSAEIISETNTITNYYNAYSSFLKLPANGSRGTNGFLTAQNIGTSLWSSDVGDGRETLSTSSIYRYFGSSSATTDDLPRAKGMGVRCIKDY